MREHTGNLWVYPADAHVITTNGFIKKDGRAVLGAGVAKQAVGRFPSLPDRLGYKLKRAGNNVHTFPCTSHLIVTMPVKHHWRDNADPELILRSAKQLVELANERKWETVASVRPGCGNGGLRWLDVCGILEPLWDDRFVIVNPI